MEPTTQQYSAFQKAFEYFNKALFENKLESVLLSFSRKSHTSGFFIPDRWKGSSKIVKHEISLNPQFLNLKPKMVYAILVHEQVHLWQHQFGKPSFYNYHNREWSEKMESIGLIPSKTGELGGEKTGRSMSHYIKVGGPYEIAFKSMKEDFLLPFKSNEGLRRGKQKLKYWCASCENSAWTNRPFKLICGGCNHPMKIQK